MSASAFCTSAAAEEQLMAEVASKHPAGEFIAERKLREQVREQIVVATKAGFAAGRGVWRSV